MMTPAGLVFLVQIMRKIPGVIVVCTDTGSVWCYIEFGQILDTCPFVGD